VILVDDDELIQSSMQAVLAVLGHRVTAALSGEEALRKVEAGFQRLLSTSRNGNTTDLWDTSRRHG